MPNAIGAGGGSGARALAGLHAEAARYRKQLADSVNCPATSSFLEGKAQIQELSNKIKANQEQIRTIERTETAPNPAIAMTAAGEAEPYTAAGTAATAVDQPGRMLDVHA